MVNILPIASGKGGVGKSAVSVNVAVSLAQKGKKVILCDFDFGGANLHTLLGLKNNQPFGTYKGLKIGFKGTLAKGRSFANILKMLGDGEKKNNPPPLQGNTGNGDKDSQAQVENDW